MTAPLVVSLLILGTCGVSLWAFQNKEVEARYIFRPERILAYKEYYRLVTCAFLHAGWAHLLLNMYTLNGFGRVVGGFLGEWRLLIIYFGSVIGGSLVSLLIHRHHDYSAYGASGGVCGVMFAFVLMFPRSHMVLFPLPYAVPAWLYAVGFVIGSFYAMKAQKDNIGHDAHLGGAIVGLLLTAQLQPALVREHWGVFISVLLLAVIIFAYVLTNPLFLPLDSIVRLPSWPWRQRRVRQEEVRQRQSRQVSRQVWEEYQREQVAKQPESHWLREQLEEHLGKIRVDETGAHDWIDKFDRSYHVVGARPEHFRIESFIAAVREHLDAPGVKFVVVDTSQLTDPQAALVRPFIADLPESQFNRVIRSYGFNPRKRQ
jgi:membrane associated rhomboid family serine protease